MISADSKEDVQLLSKTAVLIEGVDDRRNEMAELRRSLDALRANVRELQAQSWATTPEEVTRKTKELSQATVKECTLSRGLIRCSTALIETTRRILEIRRAERKVRQDPGQEHDA
jgi:hypothetical protein